MLCRRLPAISHLVMSVCAADNSGHEQREQHQPAKIDAFFHQLAHRYDGRAVALGGISTMMVEFIAISFGVIATLPPKSTSETW